MKHLRISAFLPILFLLVYLQANAMPANELFHMDDNRATPLLTVEEENDAPVLSNAKWMSAGMSDVFTEDVDAGFEFQQAIWYLENEEGESNWYLNRLEEYNFANTGWNAVGVNIASTDEDNTNTDNQSQLAANTAAVPEPATVLLFGLGLFGLGSMLRRK